MESIAVSTRCIDAPVRLADFDYHLPPELIAQTPTPERDRARMLVLNRALGTVTDTHVRTLPDHLQSGDLVVVNDTRVIPARVFGRAPSGGAIELLLIRSSRIVPLDQGPIRGGSGKAGVQWRCLGRPARRLRQGATLTFPGDVKGTVAETCGEGHYLVNFDVQGDLLTWLSAHGEIPLPPYIRRPDGPLPLDHTRYQTIFATQPGAIAAPTAGLHFTEDLVAALQARGIETASVTLHVGPGTFLPVRSTDIRGHVMDPEWCNIPEETAMQIRRARAAGRRVVAVGTTTTRALESAAVGDRMVRAGAWWASLFIVPGHQFRVVDALFTNFHLPGSTLLMLVSAFARYERTLATYAEAVRRGYRFYSYGDAMLIE